MAAASGALFLRVVNISLNFLGYVPVVSNCSANLRISYGSVYIIAGIAIVLLGGTSTLVGGATAGMIFFAGVTHIIRGCVEHVPVLGNTTCVIYDFVSVVLGGFSRFAPIF